VRNLDGALARINQWTKEHTKGRIPRLFDSPFGKGGVVLVNTVTFDGKWQTPFDPKRTAKEPFRTADGSQIETPMMHLTAVVGIADRAGATAVRLPYAGGKYSMVCILPPEGADVYRFAATLSPAGVASIISKMAPSRMDVSLPRFAFSSSFDMRPALGQMGLEPLYRGVNLSGIAPELAQGEWISQIVQKTWIKVDEAGTQAAAASGIVATRALRRAFVADRPFVFAITSDATGAILFEGIIEHPENGS